MEISNETTDDIQEIAQILTRDLNSGMDALNWLKTPQPMYSGLSPLEYIQANKNGAKRVRSNLEKNTFREKKQIQ